MARAPDRHPGSRNRAPWRSPALNRLGWQHQGRRQRRELERLTVSFRTRLFFALVLAVLVPLSALAYGLRREMERRLTAEYEGRVGSMVSVIEADLNRESSALASRLAALDSELARSDRFRLAALRSD